MLATKALALGEALPPLQITCYDAQVRGGRATDRSSQRMRKPGSRWMRGVCHPAS